MFGRGEQVTVESSGYRMLLQTIPWEDSMKNCFVLNSDLGGTPYQIDDFRTPFLQLGVLQDIAGILQYQMVHVCLIKLRTPEARQRLLDTVGLQVKRGFRAVIVPIKEDVIVQLHWVLFYVAHSDIRRMFEDYGVVKEVRQESWETSGFMASESTTRLVPMTLRDDLTPSDMPNLLKFYGGSVLFVVPGRALQCLQCRWRGHIRRDGRIPRCFKCKAFVHLGQDCVPTYANVTEWTGEPDVSPLLMDEEEVEAAAPSMAAATELHDAEVNAVSNTMDLPTKTRNT